MNERKKGICICGGIQYRKEDLIVGVMVHCRNCVVIVPGRRKADKELPTEADIRRDWNGG